MAHGPRPLPLFLDMLRSETAEDPALRTAALQGLRRYQEAPRTRRRLPPTRFRKGAARLRQVGGEGPAVVLVPSLINPPFVLDLAPGRSLAQHIAAAGFTTWLLDWGTPRAVDRELDIAGHVAARLVPLVERLDGPVLLVGYCLGGTMATAAAALLGARCAGVATIAAPWRFTGYGETVRTQGAKLWEAARPGAEALGVLPMEVLQTAFWALDPARTIRKFAAYATMDDARAAQFGMLEDWANAGAPLTYAAGADLFETLLRDDAPGEGAWQVAGRTIDPAALACPSVQFVSLTDRIVPAATAAHDVARCDLAAGHVGMVVGGSARDLLWDRLVAELRGFA